VKIWKWGKAIGENVSEKEIKRRFKKRNGRRKMGETKQ
jgi:hypothetical protein